MTAGARVKPIEETREIIPQDDSFYHHGRTQSPWWNESAWFGFMIPERKIDAYFYVWHRPNMKLSAAGVALWDPYGEERHNCLYNDWYNFNAMAEDSDMFSFELANGMKCELLEPLYRYRLQYTSEPCDIDLVWEGVHPPMELHFPENEGLAHFGGFHYEQLGRVTGTVRVEDETLEVDCHHVRDHSWGVRRRHRRHTGGGLEMGWADDRQTAFCSTMTRPNPLATLDATSLDGNGYGQIVKDGKAAKMVSGERRVTERRADGAPLRIELDLKDELGREMHAEGEIQSLLKYDDIFYLNWGLVRWNIDGKEGWGETQDWLDQDLVRAHERAVLKKGRPFGA